LGTPQFHVLLVVLCAEPLFLAEDDHEVVRSG
jgi:hypothetical protein